MKSPRLLIVSALLLAFSAVGVATTPRPKLQERNQVNSNAPTVILVHGAFADASSWAGVTERLQLAGVKVLVPSNPLRGLTADGEYIASVARQTAGPVLLVGHSYGGPVITYAGSKADNVKGLVFVASFGLDKGQSVADSTAAFPAPLLATSVEPRQYPDSSAPNGQGVELYIQKDKFAQVFASDLPAAQQALLAVSQRPASVTSLGEPLSVEPAWKKMPSWWLLTTKDNAINPESQRAAAKRIGATLKEVAASHAVAISQPGTVANFILDAVNATSK